ncbi:hypothetical protein SAMN05444695_108161 [Rhodococcus triatomae]|uniref:DUF2029 domain-containing protein n=2 Tax=Rhodococcus triatomae TaxID=300028 RepID=A0A1G8LGV4_9NOCA|nr:hypothetical protein SAMN05444695_108161 [Rhodococcus triatomae]
MALVVGLCGLSLLAGYLNKARCAGAPFDDAGRSLVFDRIKDTQVCYSDIQLLWLGRGIDQHLFPYVSGGIDADGLLTGGTVEYPVLSGVLMWLAAVGAHTDAQFLLQSALLLAPFGLLTAWMLGRMAGKWALLWSATPPLVLYAFHNWELPVVATVVGAIFLMSYERIPLRTRAILAAALLAVGFCLKIYPGLFVLPLALYVLAHGRPSSGADGPRRYDVRGALLVVASAVVTVIAVNLPFALISYDGWRASITFQQNRLADLTTNSIWYWGLLPMFGPSPDNSTTPAFDQTVGVLSPLLVLAAIALAAHLGWRRFQHEGTFPWINVGAAMLCGFLLFHKVHSPQFTLWILPFFVLLRVPWGLVAAYLAADLALGIGVFKYFGALVEGTDSHVYELLVKFGVWGRATLLVALFFVFLNAARRPAGRPAKVPAPGDDAVPVGVPEAAR